MTGFAPVGSALSTVANGVAAGIMLSTVIGIVPMMVAQPYPGYVQMVKFMWPRYDPLMPALNGTALVLAALSAAFAPAGEARTALIVAAALLATVMTISISLGVVQSAWFRHPRIA